MSLLLAGYLPSYKAKPLPTFVGEKPSVMGARESHAHVDDGPVACFARGCYEVAVEFSAFCAHHKPRRSR